MAKTKNKDKNKDKETDLIRPATSPEARENQLIALAVNLAEKQLKEGTASSQVITQFLKLGSTKNRLEMEKLKRENELLKAKTESLQSAKDIKALYQKAMDAMKLYSGNGGVSSDEQEDDEYDDY